MAISETEVRYIASLARLALPPERIRELAGDLNAILQHMDVLSRVAPDVSAEPPDEPLRPAPMRPDEGPPIHLERPMTAFAPALRDGFLLVPRLATHGDPSDQP